MNVEVKLIISRGIYLLIKHESVETIELIDIDLNEFYRSAVKRRNTFQIDMCARIARGEAVVRGIIALWVDGYNSKEISDLIISINKEIRPEFIDWCVEWCEEHIR
jgi:hypothetical protein